MKNCIHCAHAEWKKTAVGKLHPSGDGRCLKVVSVPELPKAFYWMSRPYLAGGSINRREELNDHCAYFQRPNAD